MSQFGKTPFRTRSSLGGTVIGILRALALALLATASHAAQGSRACSDACLAAARADRTDCRSSAQGVFLDTVSGCVQQDVVCVDACRTDRQDCRDATTLGRDLAACDLRRDAAKSKCRLDHALE